MPVTPLVFAVTISPVPAGLPEYDRRNWKHWTDADGDCQDARNEVLIAESATAVTFRTNDQCRVASGEWRRFRYSDSNIAKAAPATLPERVRNANL